METATAERRGGVLEVSAIVLVLIGGAVIPLLGWIAGVALLWGSRAWTVRDKLIGTLVVPGGLAPGFYLLFVGTIQSCLTTSDGSERCSGGATALELAGMVALVLAPIATAIYLARRMNHRHIPA